MDNANNEKTPDEILVEQLVGTDYSYGEVLDKVLDNPLCQYELFKIVKNAWENGATESEIQQVYDENLQKFQSSKRENKYSLKNKRDGIVSNKIVENDTNIKESDSSEGESFYDRHILAIWGIPCILTVLLIIIYGIFFIEYSYTDFNEFEIDGISFNIPSDYSLSSSSENQDAVFKKFICEYDVSWTDRDGESYSKTNTIALEISVYKSKSVQQLVSKLSSEGWGKHDATYGKYSGIRLERFGHDGGWFIFEKNGKTVAIYYERKAIQDNMEKIIS